MLLNFLGAKSAGAACRFRAVQIENRCESLYRGLWLYGRRFLCFSDCHGRAFSADLQKYQATGYCRGGCYAAIDQFFRNPQIPLTQLVQPYEEGVPDHVARLHDSGALPPGISEELLSITHITAGDWKAIPTLETLPPGVYTFLLGFSQDLNTPLLAHRIAFFKGQETFLFDLSDGLASWRSDDWVPLLDKIAVDIQKSNESGSFFTAMWYRHQQA
ncbi:MAG: hypothetical protein V4487_08425 [Chlamydiota bacterium]